MPDPAVTQFESGSEPSPGRAILEWMHAYAPYGVMTTDTQLRIQSWNHWMAGHTGKPASKVLGQSLVEVFPDLLARNLVQRFERALVGESSILSTVLHRFLLRMDSTVGAGEFAEMQQTARIAPLIVGKQITGTIVVIEDVTQREVQAVILRRQHARDAILSWALAYLLESRDPRQTIRDLFLKIAEHLDWEAYLLYLFTPGQQALKLQSSGGITPEHASSVSLLPASDPLAQTLLGAVNLPRSTTPQSSHPPLVFEKLGFSVSAVLPLRSDGELLGLLCFGARRRASLREGELELLSTIVKYLSVALQREQVDGELKAAQAKLNKHAENLENQVTARTAELREIIAELERFSYTVAHDLRAPIRALHGYCNVLLEDFSPSLPDEGQSVVRKLNRACVQLDELTLDLLEFSKISRADLTLEVIEVEEVVSAALRLLPHGSAILSIRRPLQKVLANRALLQQSITNLIDNALKFAKEGELPNISIWTETVTWANRSSGLSGPFTSARDRAFPRQLSSANGEPKFAHRVRVVIEDQGLGIDPELHQKIFGIFERGTSSAKYTGSGIGLAIVARAVERMGGACGVESVAGQGSRFWLELPPA